MVAISSFLLSHYYLEEEMLGIFFSEEGHATTVMNWRTQGNPRTQRIVWVVFPLNNPTNSNINGHMAHEEWKSKYIFNFFDFSLIK